MSELTTMIIAALGVLFIGLSKAGFGGGLGMLTTPLCVLAFGALGKAPTFAIGTLLPLLLEISLMQGWAAERSLQESLDGSWVRDRERGLTHAGPHRADLGVRFGGSPARDRISRGQQKLAAAALLLGQLRCDAELGSSVAALLVDDPAAELDSGNLERLLGEVVSLSAQLFVTALDPTNPALVGLPEGHRFHVEHGTVTRLI